jgi:hypothetical protein
VSGALLGVVVLLLVGGTGLLIGSLLRLRSAPELILATYVVAFAEVVGLSLFLSPFDAMTRGALVTGSGALFVAALGAWMLAKTPRVPLVRREALVVIARHGPVVVLAVVTALALSYVVALIVGTPPNGWDPLNYHLARAAFWVQSGHVGYIGDAYDQRLNFNPPNGEIGLAFVLGVTREETFSGFVQFFAALACSVGVFTMARRIGLPRIEATFGALVFLILPIVLLQSSGVKNDIVVASFLLAASVFVLGDSLGETGLAALATALAVGTKFTAAYGLVVLLAFALLAPPRRWRVQRIVGIALGALAGSYWYAVNAHETGHLLGDQSNVPGLTAPFHPPENVVTAYGDLVDAIDLSGAQGKDILLYLVAAILVAGVLAFQHGSWRVGGRRALLAGATVASPLVLLVLSDEVGRPSLLRLYDVVGKPQAYLAVGDKISSSPTTASDTASWFGPTGLLLMVGAGIAAVLLVRRRSLPGLASIPALAPLLWLVLVAVTLTYHPWEGRFFVFPVALSAAVWGLALRAPAAAWAAVALGATTAFLSLVHYVEKPSGLRLVDRTQTVSVWKLARWQVQSQHDPPLGPTLRFLDEDVPRHDSIALALGANEFGYPAFGPRLERRVDLVPFGSSAREVRSDWLLADPQRAAEIDSTCWHMAFRSERGTVFRRVRGCS